MELCNQLLPDDDRLMGVLIGILVQTEKLKLLIT